MIVGSEAEGCRNAAHEINHGDKAVCKVFSYYRRVVVNLERCDFVFNRSISKCRDAAGKTDLHVIVIVLENRVSARTFIIDKDVLGFRRVAFTASNDCVIAAQAVNRRTICARDNVVAERVAVDRNAAVSRNRSGVD